MNQILNSKFFGVNLYFFIQNFLQKTGKSLIIKTLYILFFFIFLISLKVIAQENQCGAPYAGTGSLRYSGTNFGCVPFTMTVSNSGANSADESYLFEYKGGNPEGSTLKKTHIYTKPGIYTLMQISYDITTGSELRVCATVAVRDTIQPPFNVKVCSNRNVVLTILPVVVPQSNIYYDKFYVDWGDGSSIAIVYSVNSSLSHTYSDNQPKKISVRGSYDYGSCGGTLTKTIQIPDVPPKPIIGKVTSLDANTTELKIENSSGLEFEILKNENGGSFQPTLVSIINSGVVKIPTDTEKNICFKLESLDACAANIVSDIACNATFQVQTDLNSNLLFWEKNVASSIKVLKDGNEMTEINTPINAAQADGFEDKNIKCYQQYCYQLIAQKGTYEAVSAVKCVQNNSLDCKASAIPIYIPDSFTPNEDGKNDELEIKGEAKYFVNLIIFDHWGRQLTDIQDITLKWNGNNLPAGVYLYQLNMKNKSGESLVKVGTILLLK